MRGHRCKYPFDKNVTNSFVSGDETWVHFSKPKCKVNNKIWAKKNAKPPCVAKRLQSSKKVMFAIFWGTKEPVTQIVVSLGTFCECPQLKLCSQKS